MKSFLTFSVFSLLAFCQTESVSAQCIDHNFTSQANQHSYSVEVSNECAKDVYFTILGQKENGTIESIVRGYLKMGETLRHKSFGKYVTEPISYEVPVTADYFKAKEAVLAFIKNAQDKGSIASVKLSSKEAVATIEEE